MNNNLNIKVTWVINEDGSSELYYDFVNPEGKYVGNVIVTDKGKVSWYIIDLTYKQRIDNLINFIMGDNKNIRLQYETKDENLKRWDNARIYIAMNKLVLNYRQSDYYTNELVKSVIK